MKSQVILPLGCMSNGGRVYNLSQSGEKLGGIADVLLRGDPLNRYFDDGIDEEITDFSIFGIDN